MSQHEFADVAIQREAVDALAGGQNQDGSRAVDAETGRYLRGALLHEILGGNGLLALGSAHDGEDGPDRQVDLDVAGAIQRIEGNQVLALGEFVRNLDDFIVFLGRHGGQVASPLQRANEDVVGQHVEFLLDFALDVFRTNHIEIASQSPAVHFMTDAFAGGSHVVQQQREFTGGTRNLPLFVDQELGEMLTDHDVLLNLSL